MLLKADQYNNIHTLNCFTILTKEPENIGPIINLKWATIICEAVSLDIEQILHFCILRAFTGI
jgi:hypothetical protein